MQKLQRYETAWLNQETANHGLESGGSTESNGTHAGGRNQAMRGGWKSRQA